MKNIVVMKFGGKSLSNVQKIEKICSYIKTRSQKEKIVVVVSAQGDTTNALLEMARPYQQEENLRELDALIATGEQQSAALFAMALSKFGMEAKSFSGFQLPILTKGKHGNASITFVGKQKILESLEKSIVVVTGFQGVDEKGEIFTIGRGGSDTTAVALGAALHCKVEIYSDFEGIFSGDPRIDNFQKLEKIEYSDIIRLAQSGAKVLNADAAMLAKEGNVSVECKGSLTPKTPGTKLVKIPQPFAAVNYYQKLIQAELIFNGKDLKISEIIEKIVSSVNFQSLSLTKFSLSVLIPESEFEKLKRIFSPQLLSQK